MNYTHKTSDVVGVNDSALCNVSVKLFGPDGALKEQREVHNLITTVGKAFLADQISSAPGSTAMTHMAIGTGTNAANASDTTLQTELDRNALTSNTDSGAVTTFVGDWAAGDGTGTITEAGIFNASSSGTMLARSVFSAINKGALDVLQITWTVTFS